ncbi:hypothetical protein FFLO_03826 [Filobasidium floriforme]|uniref:AB hydrolase-1 domain-containing protein n=1 Tax=Filobasidium floriforme TaxID=5210 RepID=A0A8K0JQC9_9TREE|nr:Alpha/beta hydrolase family-domain-containing protein [Filobasidium floriforme]KAG7532138.1 hypothetical protein FFLO_03826 [Filobasidium floriforme]KAH8083280.1 Alpha/beta hydrolase family-domain-containing protein [Filobasidium floriforme]
MRRDLLFQRLHALRHTRAATSSPIPTPFPIRMSFSTYAYPPPKFPNERYTYAPTVPPQALLPILPPSSSRNIAPKLSLRSNHPTSAHRHPDKDSYRGTPESKLALSLEGFELYKHSSPCAFPRSRPGSTRPAGKAREDVFGDVTGVGVGVSSSSGTNKDNKAHPGADDGDGNNNNKPKYTELDGKKARRKKAISQASSRATKLRRDSEKFSEEDVRRRSVAGAERGQEAESEREPLHYLAVDRWVRKRTNTKTKTKPTRAPYQGVTLVCLHANGFHKKMWVPTLQELFAISSSSSGWGGSGIGSKIEIGDARTSSPPGTTTTTTTITTTITTDRDRDGDSSTANGQAETDAEAEVEIDEILLVDIYNHAESYLLNDGRVGLVFDWQDVARDMIVLLRNCLPPRADQIDPAEVPEYLEYRQEGVDDEQGGYARRVIGVGHSIGGNALVQASHAFPDLFHSLILVDPMTRSLESHEAGGVAETLVRSCIGRRDTWPSLRAAEEDLLRSPFFRAWDKRVFNSFLQHGLCPLTRFSTYAGQQDQDEGSVGLMTPRWAEATVFAGGPGMLVGYDKLSELRRDMKVTFIMAENPSSTGGSERTHDIVWRPPRAENVIVKGAGHLVMQEKPRQVAQAMYASLNGWTIEPDEKVFADKARL